MHRRMIAAAVMSLGITICANAQAPGSFEEFRKGLMNNFNSFKDRILEHYADFLAGEWHEYESLEAESKYENPKPESIPTFETMETEERDDQNKNLLMSLDFSQSSTLDNSGNLKEPTLMEMLRSGSNIYSMASLALTGQPNSHSSDNGSHPIGSASPSIMTGNGIVASSDGDVFGFYGMQFALPKVEFTLMDSITSTLDFSKQWERLNRDCVALRVNPHILALQETTGISDYLMYEMIMSYLDHKFPNVDDASKMSGAHYLLANMGFGVRIAIDDNNDPYILLPFTEKIFGKSRIPLSKTYYVFSTPGKSERKRVGLRSPYMPDNAEQGKDMNLRMEGLNLPLKTYHYDISYDGIKLEGDLNENIIPMLYRYPQMDTGGFAASIISKEVRDDVVGQLRAQLGDMEPLLAADKLLSMIQFGFPYATDDNYHGFEKPYFFEEMLYYPKSDCEDRAIFFSYLLWNALGLENDLITYPNHEATAIRADKVRGGFDHYMKSGNRYYISDPTYQGSSTGQCMPQYIGLNPGIDYSYGPQPVNLK